MGFGGSGAYFLALEAFYPPQDGVNECNRDVSTVEDGSARPISRSRCITLYCSSCFPCHDQAREEAPLRCPACDRVHVP